MVAIKPRQGTHLVSCNLHTGTDTPSLGRLWGPDKEVDTASHLMCTLCKEACEAGVGIIHPEIRGNCFTSIWETARDPATLAEPGLRGKVMSTTLVHTC